MHFLLNQKSRIFTKFPTELKTSCLFRQRNVKYEMIWNILIYHHAIYIFTAKADILSKDITMYIKGQEINSPFLAEKSGKKQKKELLTSSCATSLGYLAKMNLGEDSTFRIVNTD